MCLWVVPVCSSINTKDFHHEILETISCCILSTLMITPRHNVFIHLSSRVEVKGEKSGAVAGFVFLQLWVQDVSLCASNKVGAVRKEWGRGAIIHSGWREESSLTRTPDWRRACRGEKRYETGGKNGNERMEKEGRKREMGTREIMEMCWLPKALLLWQSSRAKSEGDP